MANGGSDSFNNTFSKTGEASTVLSERLGGAEISWNWGLPGACTEVATAEGDHCPDLQSPHISVCPAWSFFVPAVPEKLLETPVFTLKCSTFIMTYMIIPLFLLLSYSYLRWLREDW